MVKDFFRFIGLTGLLGAVSIFFYFVTNSYYNLGYGVRDFSLYGWGLIFIIWGIGIYHYFRHRFFMIFFAVWLSVLCFVLDCYRFVIYLEDDTCLLYLRILLGLEAFYIVLTFLVHQKTALMFGLCAMIVTLAGQYLIYPTFIPIYSLMLVCVSAALLWIFGFEMPLRNMTVQKCLKCGFLLLFTLSCVWAGWLKYDQMHGIRFYEEPVTEVAKDIKVSVIVPVYNAEDTIERTLDSLRHQTLKEIEIICVDDGSTDKSGKILDEYAEHDKRIKVIHQKNAFVGAARNRGMREAKGEYIGFIDNDDWVSPNYYEELYKAAKKYDVDVASTAVVYMVAREYPEEKMKKTQRVEFENKEIIDDLAYYEDKAWGYVWDKIYKKSFLKKHNIRFSLYRTGYEDNYFSTQVYMWAHKMVNVKGIAYYYFRGDVSYSIGQNHKPTDEAPEMYVDLDKLINSADVSDVEKERWLGAAQNIRHFSFTDYYRVLSPEDKKIWKDRIREAFPEDNIDFDEIEKEEEKRNNSVIML